MKSLQNFIHLYTDGFKNMTWGKTLWIIILIKVFILFAILKIFFFPDILKSNFNTDKERSEKVSKELINR